MPSKFEIYFEKFVSKPLRYIGLFNFGYVEATTMKSVSEVQAVLKRHITETLGYTLEKEIQNQDRTDQLTSNLYTLSTGLLKKSQSQIKTSVFIDNTETKVTVVAAFKRDGFNFSNQNYQAVKSIKAMLESQGVSDNIYINC